jgi:hypothetical protein
VGEQIESERAGREEEDPDPNWPMKKTLITLVALTDAALVSVFDFDG